MPPFTRVGFLALTSVLLLAAAEQPPRQDPVKLTVPLTGQEEVSVAHPTGGTGDLHASGLVSLAVDPANKRVCYDFRLSGTSEPMMAHIHEGAPLTNGPPVIILFTGTGMSLSDCAPSTRGQLIAIAANPSHYYVSVDTTEFPDGALRGQL